VWYWAESGSFNNLSSSVFLFVAGSRGVEDLTKIFTLPHNVVSVIYISAEYSNMCCNITEYMFEFWETFSTSKGCGRLPCLSPYARTWQNYSSLMIFNLVVSTSYSREWRDEKYGELFLFFQVVSYTSTSPVITNKSVLEILSK
jgi:hypothetical protein